MNIPNRKVSFNKNNNNSVVNDMTFRQMNQNQRLNHNSNIRASPQVKGQHINDYNQRHDYDPQCYLCNPPQYKHDYDPNCYLCNQFTASQYFNRNPNHNSTLNRSRLTPHYPQKLPHSYITSGQNIQQRQVIFQPTHDSVPFQSQRRITYQPYLRKYLEYQDFIQYIPVQKTSWDYQKRIKQIQYVPKEYYQTKIQYIPTQKVQNKVRYIPIQQQILHMPNDSFDTVNQEYIHKIQEKSIITKDMHQKRIYRQGFVNNSSNFSNLNFFYSNGNVKNLIPSKTVKVQIQRKVENNGIQVLKNMKNNSPASQLNSSYEFPKSGGVMIGGNSFDHTFNPQKNQRQMAFQTFAAQPMNSLNGNKTQVTQNSPYTNSKQVIDSFEQRKGLYDKYYEQSPSNYNYNYQQSFPPNNSKDFYQYQEDAFQKKARKSLINQIDPQMLNIYMQKQMLRGN